MIRKFDKQTSQFIGTKAKGNPNGRKKEENRIEQNKIKYREGVFFSVICNLCFTPTHRTIVKVIFAIIEYKNLVSATGGECPKEHKTILIGMEWMS